MRIIQNLASETHAASFVLKSTMEPAGSSEGQYGVYNENDAHKTPDQVQGVAESDRRCPHGRSTTAG